MKKGSSVHKPNNISHVFAEEKAAKCREYAKILLPFHRITSRAVMLPPLYMLTTGAGEIKSNSVLPASAQPLSASPAKQYQTTHKI